MNGLVAILRISARIATLLIIAAVFAMFAAVPAQGQGAGTGSISGQVFNATAEAPVSDHPVTLSVFESGAFTEDVRATTDADGQFRFEGLDTSETRVYVISTSYQGIGFSSDMIQFAAETGQEVTSDITVYESTEDASVVSIRSRGLILTDVESNRGEVGLIDVTIFDVEGDRALVANEEGRAVEFPVPRNASQVTPLPGSGYDLSTATIEGATLFASSPLLPGETTATLSYTIPYTDDRLDVEILSSYPTEQLRILVPHIVAAEQDDLTVLGPDLTLIGEEQIGPQTYDVWIAEDVEPGSRIQVTYDGLVRSQIEPNTLNKLPPTVLAVTAVVAAAVIAGVIVYRRQLYMERPVTLTPALAMSAENRRDELVEQLRALEQAHGDGRVDVETYQAYRRAILEQLRLISRQMRGAGAED